MRLLLAAFAIALPSAAGALDFSDRPPSVWDLPLGAPAAALPRDLFANFACGTAGGPPSKPIAAWTDFATCPADRETGLHEVYFEHDDELKYRALSLRMDRQVHRFEYTAAHDVPVIASGLFNEDGALIGLRLVSDPRVPDDVREGGVSLGNFILNRFAGGWACADSPPAEGESAYAGQFIHRRCSKTDSTAGIAYQVEQRLMRRAGQTILDPVTHLPTSGQFESTTRFEMALTAAPDAAVLAAFREAAPPIDAALEARALNCPGCDLSGANLKRARLAGANLAGADLSGANLHGADLSGANLTGANLRDADLNRAILRRAVAEGADLSGALAYAAHFELISLRHATMVSFHAGKIELGGADLEGATVSDSDLVEMRAAGANLAGADFTRSGLNAAQLGRATLAGASLRYAALADAGLTGANLSGATLEGADLIRADLKGADLTGANLSGSRLTSANLGAAKREGARFDGAIMN